MIYDVRILHQAEVDVDTIYLWIAKRAPGGAARWYNAFLDAAKSLRLQPTQNALAPEAAAVGLDIRQLLFKTRLDASIACYIWWTATRCESCACAALVSLQLLLWICWVSFAGPFHCCAATAESGHFS